MVQVNTREKDRNRSLIILLVRNGRAKTSSNDETNNRKQIVDSANVFVCMNVKDQTKS